MIRHHIYPRKKLYIPTEDDIKKYPTLQPIRASELEDDESSLDDPNQHPRGSKDKWWTGETCFPSKPVKVMTCDMRDFLVSYVDKYCELAKVNKSSMKHVSTPFHENRIAKPTSDNEPQGHLQPIASKVLMKILFAARMARWDLLRATQS